MVEASRKTRVLLVIRCTAIGGLEVYLLDIVEALVNNGCQVSVLFTNRNGDVPSQLKEKIPSLGAEVMYQHFSISKPDAKIFCRKFSKLLDKVNPDVVFFNRSGGLGWAKFSDLITTARLKTIRRIVVAEHGHPPPFPIDVWRPFDTIRKMVHCWLHAHCLDAIICMNAAARNVYIRAGYSYPKKRVHVIYNGIDKARFRFDPELRERYRRSVGVGSRTLVLYSGRLSFEKGADVLLKAWAALSPAQRETLLLVIVGDGDMMEDLQRAAAELGIPDSVQFTGFREDVLGYLCACDIFVLPSLEESFGLSLAEAMAVGRYVIATRVGGVPELLSSSRIGTLIAPHSPEQLAEAIWAAAVDPALRHQVGAEAEKHIHENFPHERTMAQTLDVILGEVR